MMLGKEGKGINGIVSVFKQFIYRNLTSLRIFSIYSLIIALAMSICVTVNLRTDIAFYTTQYKDLRDKALEIHTYYFDTVLQDEYAMYSGHAAALRDLIGARLEDTYESDTSTLVQELDAYHIEGHEHNNVYNIISDTTHQYLQKWYPSRYDIRVVVLDKDKILFTSNNNDIVRHWSGIPSALFNHAFDDVPILDNNTAELKFVKINELKDNPPILAGKSFIAEKYIYDNTDIVGVNNITAAGQPSSNHQIAVMIIYPALDYKSTTIVGNYIDYLNKSRDTNLAKTISDSIQILIALFIACVILAYIMYTLDAIKIEEEDQ